LYSFAQRIVDATTSQDLCHLAYTNDLEAFHYTLFSSLVVSPVVVVQYNLTVVVAVQYNFVVVVVVAVQYNLAAVQHNSVAVQYNLIDQLMRALLSVALELEAIFDDAE
jgi:hypothetical protein